MSNINKKSEEVKPITERKNVVEEALKKDNTSEALAMAIKSILSRDNNKK